MIWFKLAATLAIITAGLVGGLIPTRAGVTHRGMKFLGFGNAVSAGIFLGAGLLHMLADALENFRAASPDGDYPYAILICGCGFLLVLLLDKVLLREEELAEASGNHTIYPFILTLVLSIHSIIAGAALGLERSLVSSFVIFIAIVSHKGCAAFALGVSLREAEFPKNKALGVVAIFSCMTPLGIVIGSLFSAVLEEKAAYLVEAVFDGVAAGTFLYIAILDIMVQVFLQREDRWTKFLLMALGFVLMALIAIWT